jgi:hypothetical protein
MQKDYENCITTVNKLGNIPTLPLTLPVYFNKFVTIRIFWHEQQHQNYQNMWNTIRRRRPALPYLI